MYKFLTLIICIFFGISLSAQIVISNEEQEEINNLGGNKKFYNTWTWRTTYLIPKNEIHIGIITPLRYRLAKKLELESQIFLFPLIPNIAIKKRWFAMTHINNRWSFASRHGLYYPTPGLKYLRNSGFKDILHDTTKIPQIFALKNEFIVSFILNPNCEKYKQKSILTFRTGIDWGMNSGETNLPQMTFYTLYHRASVAYGDYMPYAGLQLDAHIANLQRLNFTFSVDYFKRKFENNHGIESLAMIHYFFNSKISLTAGGFIHISKNEIESDTNYFPFVNLIYKFNHKRIRYGLFKKKIK